MKKKDRVIEATVIMSVKVYIDSHTEAEDVFNNQNLYPSSECGMITDSKIIHVAITKDEKLN